MALTLIVGSLALTEFIRGQRGDGLQPYAPDLLQPQFAQSPLREGGRLIQENVNLEERVYPLWLNDQSPALLRTLEQNVNRELRKPALTAAWVPPGSASLTFHDVEYGRFEPDYSLRHDEHGYMAGVLRLWTQPYGHTGTTPIIATSAGTGIAHHFALPSALAGDVEALTDISVRVGSQADQDARDGRLVAVAVVPTAYVPVIPAASLFDLNSGATLLGASGAQASQAVALFPIASLGATAAVAARFALEPASLYAGANRILGVVRNEKLRGHGLSVVDPYLEPIGPTAQATALRDWSIVDLGIARVPRDAPSQVFTIRAGALGASGYGGGGGLGDMPSALASYSLWVNEIIVLPEDRTAVVVDTPRRGLAYDAFDAGTATSALADRNAQTGQAWLPATEYGATTWFAQDSNIWNRAAESLGLQTLANRLDTDLIDDMRARAHAQVNFDGSMSLWLRKRGASHNVFIDGMLHRANNSGTWALSITAGGNPTTVLASMGLAQVTEHVILEFGTEGPAAWVSIRKDAPTNITYNPGAGATSGPLACVGASSLRAAFAGQPMVMAKATVQPGGGDVRVHAIEVTELPSSGYPARGVYRFDGPNDRVRRSNASAVPLVPVDDRKLGVLPQLPVPTPGRIVAVVAPMESGPANGLIDIEVRVRERFRFAR